MTGRGGEPPSSLLSGRLASPHLVFRSRGTRPPVSPYPPAWDGALQPEGEEDDPVDAALAPLLGTLQSRVDSFAATQDALFERQEELFRRTRTGLDGLTPAAEADFALARLQSMRTAVDAAKAELAAGAERTSKDIRALKTTLRQIGARLDASVERTEEAMTLLERAMEKESAERGARQTELTALGSLVEALDGQLRERARHAAEPPPKVLADKIVALSGRLAQIEDDLAAMEAAAPPPGVAAKTLTDVAEGLAAHESRTSALVSGLEAKVRMLWDGLKRSAETHGSTIGRMHGALSALTARVSHLERTVTMRAAQRAQAAPRTDAAGIAPTQSDRPAPSRRAPGRSILSRRLLNIARGGSTSAVVIAALVALTALIGPSPVFAQSPLTDDEIEIAPHEELFTEVIEALGQPKSEPSSVDLLLDAAKAGDPISQYVLSLAYRTGNGVARDLASANVWQERAAQQGLAIAALAMGQRRFAAPEDAAADRSPETAYAWFVRAAEGGNLKAMYNVAVALAAGDGVERNARDAARWFSEAARRGYVDAQYNLGLLYAHGYGVHQSDAIAYMWLAIAAAQGDRSAAQRRDDLVARLAPEIRERLDAYAVAFEPLPADPIANGLFPTAPETYIASLARTGEPVLVDRVRPEGTDGGTPAAAVLRRGNGPT